MTDTHVLRPAQGWPPAAIRGIGFALLLFSAGCGAESGGKSVFDLATAAEFMSGGDRCRVNVYLFRGLLDEPSAGLNDLADTLRAAGMNAVAQPYTTWEGALADIETQLAGEAPPRLVLGGHSYGADNAVLLARELAVRGIEVELLFLIDATTPPPVPANVGRCVQIYNPNDFADATPEAFPGNPVFAELGNDRTQVINLRARVEDLGPEAASIDVAAGLLVHLTLDSEPVVHRMALTEMAALCGAP